MYKGFLLAERNYIQYAGVSIPTAWPHMAYNHILIQSIINLILRTGKYR